MARVAVVIPTYNRAHLIAETIDSVLTQSDVDLEVVVVDDGSADDTSTVVGKYRDRVRYLRQPHSGNPASARNLGAQVTGSVYLAFLDSDDVWRPGKIARQITWLLKHPDHGMVFTDAAIMDARGQIDLAAGTFLTQNRWSGRTSLEELFSGNFIPNPTPLVRRAVFDGAGGFDPSLYHADYDLWLRIRAVHSIGCLPEVTAQVRRGHSRMSSNGLAMLMGDVVVLEKFRYCFPSEYRSLGATGRRRFSDAHLAVGIAQHDQENRRSALSAVYRALQIDPGNRRAWIRLALLTLRGVHVVALSRVRSEQSARHLETR